MCLPFPLRCPSLCFGQPPFASTNGTSMPRSERRLVVINGVVVGSLGFPRGNQIEGCQKQKLLWDEHLGRHWVSRLQGSGPKEGLNSLTNPLPRHKNPATPNSTPNLLGTQQTAPCIRTRFTTAPYQQPHLPHGALRTTP